MDYTLGPAQANNNFTHNNFTHLPTASRADEALPRRGESQTKATQLRPARSEQFENQTGLFIIRDAKGGCPLYWTPPRGVLVTSCCRNVVMLESDDDRFRLITQKRSTHEQLQSWSTHEQLRNWRGNQDFPAVDSSGNAPGARHARHSLCQRASTQVSSTSVIQP